MGLDSYLEKVKRVKGITLNEIVELNNYFDWVTRSNKYKNCTPEEYTGRKMENVNLDFVKDYITEYKHRYAIFDKNKEYGWFTLFQQIGYWRKANHIHNWFVENVQNGEDDCGYYEVTKDQLEQLLDICIQVRDASRLVKDEYTKRIQNPTVAQTLLPTCSGFFFGGTEYDEWYLKDIRETIKVLRKVLRTTDFEKEIVVYVSSW